MASLVRHAFNRALFKSTVSTLFRNNEAISFTAGRRHIFSSEILGLERYERQRMSTLDQMGDMKDKFRQRMDEYMERPGHGTIFTDDLKTMLHVAESEGDLDTTVKMIRRFCEQSKELRFGKFMFGPLVMRMFCFLKKPDAALELFMDPAFQNDFFDQMASYTVLLDMLYEAGQYEDVLNVYNIISDRQLGGFRHPVDATTLFIASCFRLNTGDCLERVEKLLKDASKSQTALSGRAIYLATMLALNQGKPETALEILALSKSQPWIVKGTVNLKAMTYAALGRVEDAVGELRSVVQRDVPQSGNAPKIVLATTISQVQDAVEKLGDEECTRQFTMVQSALVDRNFIDERSIETFLTQTITRVKQTQDSYKARRSYGRPQSQRRNYNHNRAGLTDLD